MASLDPSSVPPPVKKRRQRRSSAGSRKKGGKEAPRGPSATSIMSGVPSGFAEPIPEFDPQASDAYFFAPIAEAQKPPRQVELWEIPTEIPPATREEVGVDWLKERVSHWSNMPQCIEEAVEAANTRISALAEATGVLSVTLTEAFREATKNLEKPKKSDESRHSDPYTLLSTEHVSLKRKLDDYRKNMELLGSALQVLASNHTELVRRTRQSIRTVTVHTRLYPTFMPSTPGTGLLKDPFINQ